jgi:uncharacterized delta-60 repeat protein
MKRMKALVSFLIVLGVVSAAQAAPGDLDTGFSGDGKIVETGLPSTFANAVAIQADGKIVVVGESAGDFAVVRYLPNGNRDTTFSGDGLVVTSFGSALSIDRADAVAIQSDGKIVVAGRVGAQSNSQVGVARYHPNGTLDTTFSGDGLFTMEFATPGGGGARGVAIQADGKIIVVGSTGADFAIARLNAGGTLDTTFGVPFAAGIVTRDFGSANESASAVAILADGRIVVAGSTSVGGRDVFAFDYLSAGGVPQFVGPGVGNGAQHTSFGASVNANARAMAIQDDGRIVLVGDLTVLSGGGQVPTVVDRGMGIARYNPDGTMDTTFASVGLRGIDFGPFSFARAVAIQPDGKIVVVGHVDQTVGAAANVNFAVARLNIAGSLDSTFSGDGLLTTDFSGTTNDFGGAVAVQSKDGRIVAAGSAGARIALARYHAFTCNGANVTIVGTNGPDVITGTGKADVIHGLGGDDTINGGDGDDIICGGSGDDILNGGPGNDTLVAGLGRDTLNGGPSLVVGGSDGTDICLGSNTSPTKDPLDTFISCETISTGGGGVSGEWLDIEQHCNQSQGHPHCRLEGALRVFNPGTETTAVPSVVAFYLSADDALDEGDTFLGTEDVRALEAGDEDIVKLHLKLADGANASGLHVIAVVDFYDDVAERNETNNLAVSPVIFLRRAQQPR